MEVYWCILSDSELDEQSDPDPRKKVWIWILQNDTDLRIWILHTASALVITGTEQFTFEITLKTLNRHKNLKLK